MSLSLIALSLVLRNILLKDLYNNNKNTTTSPLAACAYTKPNPRVLPCLHCRSETGTARVMTSGLTGVHPPVCVSGPCGWSRAQELYHSKVQSPSSIDS